MSTPNQKSLLTYTPGVKAKPATGTTPVGPGVVKKVKDKPNTQAPAATATSKAKVETASDRELALIAELERLKAENAVLAKSKGKPRKEQALSFGLAKSGCVVVRGGPLPRGASYYHDEFEALIKVLNMPEFQQYLDATREDPRVVRAVDRRAKGIKWADVKEQYKDEKWDDEAGEGGAQE